LAEAVKEVFHLIAVVKTNLLPLIKRKDLLRALEALNQFPFYKTAITILLSEPSPALFIAITQYSISVFSGWSIKVL